MWKPLPVSKFNSQIHRNWRNGGLGALGVRMVESRQKRLSLGATVGPDFLAEGSTYFRDTFQEGDVSLCACSARCEEVV